MPKKFRPPPHAVRDEATLWFPRPDGTIRIIHTEARAAIQAKADPAYARRYAHLVLNMHGFKESVDVDEAAVILDMAPQAVRELVEEGTLQYRERTQLLGSQAVVAFSLDPRSGQ